MPKDAKPNQKSPRQRPPATTPEADENQMISLAMELVRKRLIEGTASSQETTHFLKLGSPATKLEQEILETKKELMQAKTDSIKSGKRVEELYEKALKAMQSYSGQIGGDVDDFR